jgi:hypothetical protein
VVYDMNAIGNVDAMDKGKGERGKNIKEEGGKGVAAFYHWEERPLREGRGLGLGFRLRPDLEEEEVEVGRAAAAAAVGDLSSRF